MGKVNEKARFEVAIDKITDALWERLEPRLKDLLTKEKEKEETAGKASRGIVSPSKPLPPTASPSLSQGGEEAPEAPSVAPSAKAPAPISRQDWLKAVSEHLKSCPECFRDIWEDVYSSSEYYCPDCYFPLGSEEDVKAKEACPGCGGKRAVRIGRKR